MKHMTVALAVVGIITMSIIIGVTIFNVSAFIPNIQYEVRGLLCGFGIIATLAGCVVQVVNEHGGL